MRFMALLMTLAAGVASAQQEPADALWLGGGDDGRLARVLLVSGLNVDPEERQAHDAALIRLRHVLTREMNLPEDAVTILVDDNSFVMEPDGQATAERIEAELRRAAAELGPDDAFWFYYAGQANVVGEDLRLNLPGPDCTQRDLAAWFEPMTAALTLITLDCPGAGLAATALAGQGRVVVCGARADQPYSTRFSEYFTRSLAGGMADRDGDGLVTLLEAFQTASEDIDTFYREQNLMKTEAPLLEDDGDGIPSLQPWRWEQESALGPIDGQRASRIVIMRSAQWRNAPRSTGGEPPPEES